MTSTVQTLGRIETRTGERLAAVAMAALFGFGLVFMAGFSPASVLHNAAHDFRHTQNFPCH
ncbi:CbtB domain-containing protein [Methylobacterium sp. sgz302541]|uniref:CbtB domain-containing protein n=1 Tax=unclassified Methylobacterium TaxID=2615210 RepID=UPI003D3403AB